MMIVAALSLVLAATAVTITVVHEVKEPATAEASAGACVVGILSGGAGIVTTALSGGVAPIIAYLGWGSQIVGFGISIQSCQTGYLKNILQNYRARSCHGNVAALTYLGGVYVWPGTLVGYKYSGVGTGGGGGCSGSW